MCIFLFSFFLIQRPKICIQQAVLKKDGEMVFLLCYLSIVFQSEVEMKVNCVKRVLTHKLIFNALTIKTICTKNKKKISFEVSPFRSTPFLFFFATTKPVIQGQARPGKNVMPPTSPSALSFLKFASSIFFRQYHWSK